MGLLTPPCAYGLVVGSHRRLALVSPSTRTTRHRLRLRSRGGPASSCVRPPILSASLTPSAQVNLLPPPPPPLQTVLWSPDRVLRPSREHRLGAGPSSCGLLLPPPPPVSKPVPTTLHPLSFLSPLVLAHSFSSNFALTLSSLRDLEASKGEDEASSSLKQSTLVNESVAEVIGNCCIFLHLKQGNIDASQFSAIYPQKAIPSISVIGLNGVMLWAHEGYISSKDLKENIEKTWATLHLQETAAAFLTASLASRMNEPVNTTSNTLPTQGGSSAAENPSTSSSQSTGTSGASGFANSNDLATQLPGSTSHDETPRISEKECSNLDLCPGNKTVQERPDSDSAEVKVSLPDHPRSSNIKGSANPDQTGDTASLKQKNKLDDGYTNVSSESVPTTTAIRGKSLKITVDQDKATTASTPVEPVQYPVKSNDIQLVIRIPDGPSLQIKLTKDDNLRKLKNFVDENRANGAGSYDLAMLYPRKVFSEQDLEATLHELGIETRQALTVVPHRKTIRAAKRQSSSPPHDGDNNMDADNSDGWGYFGYLRTALSIVNPLSYLRANAAPSNPEQLANQGLQQYRPSSGPWNRPAAETGLESQVHPGNESQLAAARDNNSSGSTLRRRPRQFGGNIHSLRSDDQGPSDDRNVYWNGNSTEFGGEDKK